MYPYMYHAGSATMALHIGLPGLFTCTSTTRGPIYISSTHLSPAGPQVTTTPPAYPCPGTPHATTTCTPCRQCYHGAPCSPSWAFYFYFLGPHLDQQYHLSPAGPGNLIYNLYNLLWASSTMVAKLAGFLSCFFLLAGFIWL